VVGVVNVDVGAGAWVDWLDLPVTVALVTLPKRHMHGLLHQQSALDVVSLLFVDLVVVGSRVANISLLSVRCVQFVFPESLSLR